MSSGGSVTHWLGLLKAGDHQAAQPKPVPAVEPARTVRGVARLIKAGRFA